MASPLTVDLVLVPVDGSDAAITAARYAVEVAAAYSGRVHAMYVHGEKVARAVDAGIVDESDAAATARSVLDVVHDIASGEEVPLTDSTAYGFSVDSLRVHPGSVVLDAAQQINADFIVVPRESSLEEGVLEKAAEYVLLYASQPVLSV